MKEQENAGASKSNETFLKVENIDFQSHVQIAGDLEDALFNWLVLTHSICVTYDLPSEVLAVAMPSGVKMVQDAAGKVTLTKIDLDGILGGDQQ